MPDQRVADPTRPRAITDHQPERRGPFTIGVAAATTVGLSPRWVHYSGVSLAARAAAEVLADMATMRPHGDHAPVLDRERLAYFVGIGRADKLAPVLAELDAIGFLTIYSGDVDPATGRRRQRRNSQGHPLPDRFAINLHPPSSYVGPGTLTEADAAFVGDRDAAHQAATDTGRRVRTGNLTIHRTTVGHLADPQVGADPGIRGRGEAPDPGFRGQLPSPQVSADPRIRGQGDGTDPRFRGQAPLPQVGADPGIRGPLQIDRSTIEERRSIEPVPGGPAAPPATGSDEHQAAAVRQLVQRLPWGQWAKLRNPAWRLSPADADTVQAAICAAVTTAGITLDQAAAIGQAALAEAKTNPVGYLVDAYGTHLARRLRALAVEPLSDTPLPLRGSPPKGTTPTPAATPAAGASDTGQPPTPPRPDCLTCDAHEGDELGIRTVTGPDRREYPCPDCNPDWRIGPAQTE